MFALYLTCLFLGTVVQTINVKLSSPVHQESGFLPVNIGDSVTLQCSYNGDLVRKFFWYKQTLGQKPRLMSTYYKHNENGYFQDEFRSNPRFTLETKNEKNDLKISDLHISDSATYYCASSYSNMFDFAEGITVIVKGSGWNLQALVHQPASVTIQPGDSVTLNCTIHTSNCDGEHGFYWIRGSEESHPVIIYSNGVRNDQCERKPKVQTQTCVYNFEVDVSDAGTYYCAVASCGEILFGNRTNVDIEHEGDPLFLVCFLSGALAITIILIVILAFSLYKMKKRISCQCTAPSMSNPEGPQDTDLHYAALRETRGNRARRQRDNTKNECVYSSIRQ